MSIDVYMAKVAQSNTKMTLKWPKVTLKCTQSHLKSSSYIKSLKSYGEMIISRKSPQMIPKGPSHTQSDLKVIPKSPKYT